MKKIVIAILITAGFILGCNNNSGDKKAELEKLRQEHDKLSEQIRKLEDELTKSGVIKTKVTDVTVTELIPQDFNHYVEVQGKIDGDDNTIVTSKTPGVVTRIYVNQGASVKKGQVLAELDCQVLKQTLEELKSTLDYITKLYEKQKTLWDQKIGSEVQYLTAKNNKESLEKKLQTLAEQVEMSKLVAPITGTIEDMPLKIGQSIAPGMIAFRILNLSSMKIIADVSENYSSKIKTGDKVKIFFPDLNNEIVANVSFASKFINPINRTFQVEVKLNPILTKGIEIRANMLAVVKINDYNAKNVIVIPVNIIQNSGEGQFIYITKEENGKKIALRQTIKSSLSYNGMVEVTDGLKAGDKYISSGYQDLNNNQAINY